MNQAIDLHVHSTRSDGTFSPSQLVDYAMEKRLKAFALTDHDTVDGLDEAIHYAESLHSRSSAPQACAADASHDAYLRRLQAKPRPVPDRFLKSYPASNFPRNTKIRMSISWACLSIIMKKPS